MDPLARRDRLLDRAAIRDYDRARARAVRIANLAGCFSALLLTFFLAARPWYLSWGADDGLARVRPKRRRLSSTTRIRSG